MLDSEGSCRIETSKLTCNASQLTNLCMMRVFTDRYLQVDYGILDSSILVKAWGHPEIIAVVLK